MEKKIMPRTITSNELPAHPGQVRAPTRQHQQQPQQQPRSAESVSAANEEGCARVSSADLRENFQPPETRRSTAEKLISKEELKYDLDLNNCNFKGAQVKSTLSSHSDEDASRLEAELDEMPRWVGPVAKSLFSPVASSPLVDANSFADALGVSPLYKQKESQRWSSALHVYQQMSHENTSASLSRMSEDDELAALYSTSVDAVVGDFDENLRPDLSDNSGEHSKTATPPLRPSAPPPHESTLTPISVPARPPEWPGHPAAAGELQTAQDKTVIINSNNTGLSPNPAGFMTPPARTGFWTASAAAAAGRKSSSVSPGESSLNSLELEAIAAVHELQFAVKDVYVSEMLPRTSDLIFLNVTTLEGQAYCVELTMKGWRVTSLHHDCMKGDIDHLELHICYFETIYALMDRISPAYRQRFTDTLSEKLKVVAAERRGEAVAAAAAPSVVTHHKESIKEMAPIDPAAFDEDGENADQKHTFT